MQETTRSIPLAQTLAAIERLDLAPILFKVTCEEDGYGWSTEHAQRIAQAYKRYLVLLAKHPEVTIAPTRDIDRFWHAHILDTRKYALDCERIFGGFLHHFPYLGLRGEADKQVQEDAAEAMRRLYAQEFGEALPANAAYCARQPVEAAYCARQPETAYCARSAKDAEAAYCARQPAEAAYCARQPAEAAYCARQPETAYCARGPQAAYCARGTQDLG